MRMLLNCFGLTAAAMTLIPVARAQAPSVEELKQVLNRSLQKLRPDGFTERNVLFQDVRAGTPSNGEYPFQVTGAIRDYGPGYPANRFYGTTCVGPMDKRVFRMSRDEFGEWKVGGAMTVTSSEGQQCKQNPSAGVSSIPLASLQGTQAAAGSPARAPAPVQGQSQAQGQGNSSSSLSGEWACYGTGGHLLIGLGFRAQPNGEYTDLDRKSKGTYTVQAGTINFRGGHLNGQVGRNFRGNKFVLTSGPSCEPFH